MFKPNTFLSFTDIKYNLNDNEIVLLQSLLTQEYFDELIPDNKSKYISFSSYDTVKPNISVKYDNVYEKDFNEIVENIENKNTEDDKIIDVYEGEDIEKNKEIKIYNECSITIKKIYTKYALKYKGYKEIVFSSENNICSFDIALTLIHNYTTIKTNINEIKNVLIKEYDILFKIYPENIVNLLDYYGYILSSKQLLNNNITIEFIIRSEQYNITNFDLLIISNIYNIPITLIAPHIHKENEKEYMCLNITNNNTFIIRTPGINKYKYTIPKYKLFVNNANEGLISIVDIPDKIIQQEIISQDNNLIELLQSYKPDSKPINKSNIKKKIKIV
jgi:hypothetical protein